MARNHPVVLLLVTGIICSTPVLAATTLRARSAISIPAGRYYSFFKTNSGAEEMQVLAFRMDPAPVTRAAYLEFVRTHPTWRKSNVKPLFAEANYLADWTDDLNAGTAPADAAVTFVSWFAARAYCSAEGKRLPTVAEWERVAGNNGGKFAGEKANPVQNSANASEPFRFAMGSPVTDLRHRQIQVGRVWEWNSDFNSAPVSDRSGVSSNSSSSLFCGDGYRSTNTMNYAAFLRYSLRSSLRGSYALKNLGFRCAQDK